VYGLFRQGSAATVLVVVWRWGRTVLVVVWRWGRTVWHVSRGEGGCDLSRMTSECAWWVKHTAAWIALHV
jgi:hypothetical protein